MLIDATCLIFAFCFQEKPIYLLQNVTNKQMYNKEVGVKEAVSVLETPEKKKSLRKEVNFIFVDCQICQPSMENITTAAIQQKHKRPTLMLL